MVPNTHHSLFQLGTTFWEYLSRKLYIVCGRFTHRTTALLSEMSIFCVRAGCEYDWRVITLNMHRSLFALNHLCVLTHITWKYNEDVLHIEWLLYYQSDFLRSLKLHERPEFEGYDPRHSSVVLFYIAIWCATTLDNKTHVPYDCTLHIKGQLYCQWYIILLEQGWLAARYTLQCLFNLIIYSNINVTNRYYPTSLQVCCQAAKKL